MPTWLKLVLGAVAVAVLGCGLVVAGAAYWFDSNKGKLKELGDRAQNEGKAFGASSDAEACVTEALRRLDEKSGFMEQVEHKVFLSACLDAASRPDTFCDEVPEKSEMMRSATWAIAECARREHPGDESCNRLVQAIQEACFEVGRKSK